MKTFSIVRFAALTVLAALAGPAFAAPLNIIDIVGGWTSAVPPGTTGLAVNNSDNQGTDTIRWGTPVIGGTQSGYNFTPSANILGVPLATAFQLGTFEHVNQPVFGAITSVQYLFGFSTNGVPAALADFFDFAQDETPNVPPLASCAGGVDGPSVSICDDFVDISSVNLNQMITVGTDDYFFNLLGFSKDGGTTINTQFQSSEGGTNAAGLYGIITANPVPEPATLALLGLGLAGLGFRRRLR